MMNPDSSPPVILGVIAEYDPFHNGHLYHLTEAKKQVRPDLTYIVLSPCVRQRGELSLLSPADRAFCALSAGADAVFCLPVLWTVRDAEHYALGAVSLLARLGATHLAFGAETADTVLLRQAAEHLERPSPAFQRALKDRLSSGTGYPAAVSAALSASLPDADGLLGKPNNILAVCYLRAVLRLGLSLRPVAVPRSGNYHAAEVSPVSPSASALRESLSRGSYAASYAALPDWSASLVRRRYLDGRVPDPRVFDALLVSRLRAMSGKELAGLPDLSEGMEHALRAAAVSARGREDLVASLAGKRYPAARISRLCCSALLGLTAEQADSAPLPDRALLLGLRRNPRMTALWNSLPIPVVSSYTEWKKAAHPSDLAAWRLWAMCCRLPDTLPFTEKIAML